MEILVILLGLRSLIATFFFFIAGLVLLWAHFYLQFGLFYADLNSGHLMLLFVVAVTYLVLTILVSNPWLYILLVFRSGNDEKTLKFAKRLIAQMTEMVAANEELREVPENREDKHIPEDAVAPVLDPQKGVSPSNSTTNMEAGESYTVEFEETTYALPRSKAEQMANMVDNEEKRNGVEPIVFKNLEEIEDGCDLTTEEEIFASVSKSSVQSIVENL